LITISLKVTAMVDRADPHRLGVKPRLIILDNLPTGGDDLQRCSSILKYYKRMIMPGLVMVN
jgi:hypothetical protein